MIKHLMSLFTLNWNHFNITPHSLAITGAIRGSSIEKIYEELGLESLKLKAGSKTRFKGWFQNSF